VVVDHKIKKRLVHFAFDNSNLIFFYGRLPWLCKCCSCQTNRLHSCHQISVRVSWFSKNKYHEANNSLNVLMGINLYNKRFWFMFLDVSVKEALSFYTIEGP
jgi:hypothetical protein